MSDFVHGKDSYAWQRIVKIEVIGNLGGGTQSRTVYLPEGVAPTLCSGMDHGNTMPYILEVTDEQNKSDRADG